MSFIQRWILVDKNKHEGYEHFKHDVDDDDVWKSFLYPNYRNQMKISRLPRLEICSQIRSWQKSSQIIPLWSALEATMAELSWDYRLDEVSNY